MAALTIPVEEIRVGDFYVDPDTKAVAWEAVEDAVTRPDPTTLPGEPEQIVVTVLVRFADGGDGYRAWDPGSEIDIRRAWKTASDPSD